MDVDANKKQHKVITRFLKRPTSLLSSKSVNAAATTPNVRGYKYILVLVLKAHGNKVVPVSAIIMRI